MTKKITQLNQGDFLTFKASDNHFKLFFCTSVFKQASPHNFTFAATNYSDTNKPTTESIIHTKFYGIGNRRDEYFKYPSDQLENMWSVHPEIKPNFLGSYGLTIWRKEFMSFRDNFELIGNLNIVTNLDKNGNGSMNASDKEVLNDLFVGNINELMEQRGQQLFETKAILAN
ncbi:GIY-YIG nuclease family protein [Reichenbachiella sp. MSK19-1]|uniref:GIY-YIG nuclease family protein n=1 Tax=Reichenbachiella sp. MSK19-1 TaxID=1897631 RepID=UPI000E6C3930|nr:GIY-YIG nuclease family protein [Reichenbachiella sp. MSK19-1]RJE73083.1 hypothetical protein BGP76_03845 [Reichenbachiella sp. MSK19-1]